MNVSRNACSKAENTYLPKFMLKYLLTSTTFHGSMTVTSIYLELEISYLKYFRNKIKQELLIAIVWNLNQEEISKINSKSENEPPAVVRRGYEVQLKWQMAGVPGYVFAGSTF